MNPAEHLTLCRFCGEVVAKNKHPLNIPLDGMPDLRGLKYLSGLQEHLKSRHPQNAAALEAAAREFGGMLLAQCFQADDASFNARANLIRDTFINQFALNITDDQLEVTLTKLCLPVEKHAQMLKLITSLRDVFTCRGRYEPKSSAADPPLVLVP